MEPRIAVALEIGPKGRVFAQALDWIGWCRSGRDEAGALAGLVTAGQRYARAAERAGSPFAAPASAAALAVVERVAGNATTDFGAPAVPLAADAEPLADADVGRLARLLAACWATFDEALGAIPAELRGAQPERGRAPDAMRRHLLETDLLHLAAFGHVYRTPDPAHLEDQEAETRALILAGLRAAPRGEPFAPGRRYGFAWTPRFAVRRAAWHALDHAWELEDRRP